MTFTRFLVAKYVADIQRMEPKNVGVIGWRDGLVSAHFAGETEGMLRPTRLVAQAHRKGYVTAVQSWRLQFNKSCLSMGKGRDDAPRDSADFLEALKLYSTRQFVIGEGGHVTTQPSRTLDSVIDELFAQLVDDSAGQDGRHKSALVQSCEAILQPLMGNDKFHPNLEVPCNTMGTEFPFTYAYGDPERPDVLMQTVTVTDMNQVGATAMKFRCVVEDEKFITPSKCACLVGELPNTDKMRRRLTLLNKYSTIVSVTEPEAARRQLLRMGLPLLQVGS